MNGHLFTRPRATGPMMNILAPAYSSFRTVLDRCPLSSSLVAASLKPFDMMYRIAIPILMPRFVVDRSKYAIAS